MNLSQKTTVFANRRPYSGPPDVTYRTITITPAFSNADTTVTWTITSDQDKAVTYNYQYPGLTDDMVTDPTANGTVYFNIFGEATIVTNLDPTKYTTQGLLTELQIVTPYGILTTHPLEIQSVDSIQIQAASGELQANVSTTAWGNTQVIFTQTEEVVFTRVPTTSKDVEIALVGGGGAQEESQMTPTLISGPETDGSGNERIKFDDNNPFQINFGGTGGDVLHTVVDILGNATVGANTTISVGLGGDSTTGSGAGSSSQALNQTASGAVDSNTIDPSGGASSDSLSATSAGVRVPAYFNLAPGANTDPLSNLDVFSTIESANYYAGNSERVKVMRSLGPNSWSKPLASNTYVITSRSIGGVPEEFRIGIEFVDSSPASGLYAIVMGSYANGLGRAVDITGETVYYGGGGGNTWRGTQTPGVGVDWANVSTISHPMDCLNEPWPGGGGQAGHNAAYTNGTAFEDKHAHTALIPYATNPVYCDGSPYKCTNLPPADNSSAYYESAATGSAGRPNSGAGAAGASVLHRAETVDQFCLSGESSINFVTYKTYQYGTLTGEDGIVIMSWVPDYTRAFKSD